MTVTETRSEPLGRAAVEASPRWSWLRQRAGLAIKVSFSPPLSCLVDGIY